jgi:hypothetical protein
MKNLEDILTIVTEGVDEIETLVMGYPELEPDVEYLSIPLKLKDRNLLVHLEVIRVADDIPIFSYDVVLCKDADDQFTISVSGYETLCTSQEQFEEFERCAAEGIDSLPSLESVFTPEELTIEILVSDFISKFNSITKNVYGITNAIP